MAGSTFGTVFRVTTWGESHGKALGVVVDGVPAGLTLNEDFVQQYLNRRKPGQNRYTTSRAEKDQVEILSGVFEGRTTGTPVSMIIFNRDQRSGDYSEISSFYRPGHADETFDAKYGFRDYRGGGRSSGRETIGRVAGGAIALSLLSALGIQFTSYTDSIGPVSCDPSRFDAGRILASPLYMPDPIAEEQAAAYLDECVKEQTSAGGTAVCRITGMMPGIGEPVFDKLDARLGQAMFSIGAVKAVEIGDGCAVSSQRGHETNDQYAASGKRSNHAGGMYGGISDGSEIVIRVHFKPTPSISRPQSARFRDGSTREISIKGRHDPVIVPRAVVVTEAMAAVTLADLILINMGSTIDNIRRFYNQAGNAPADTQPRRF